MPTDFSINQHYDNLFMKANHKLFEDDEFKPENQEFTHCSIKKSDVIWKRPTEIHPKPVLFSRVRQTKTFKVGVISNKILINACLLLRKELMPKIMPDILITQDWPKEYRGIFRFRFWKVKEWVEVVIDDKLPFYKENEERLFTHSDSHREEFAIALLEKALAKLYGGYKVLHWITNLAEIMEDLTGGIPERLSLKQYRIDVKMANYLAIQELYDAMFCNYSNKDPIGLTISAQTQEITNLGLHAHPSIYTISGICTIPTDSQDSTKNKQHQMMLRLRNVWNLCSHTKRVCPLWHKMSKEDREKNKLDQNHANDLWITIEDFIDYFDVASCCHIVDNIDNVWCERSVCGQWSVIPKLSAALEDFDCLENPQYYFDVHDTTVMVHIQLTRTSDQYREDGYGLIVLKVEPNRINIVKDIGIFSKRYKIIETNLPYVEKRDALGNITRVRVVNRSVNLSLYLEKGRYVLIPATILGNTQDHYQLRVATHNRRTTLLPLQDPKKDLKMFTKFELIEVTGLDMKDAAEDSAIHVECSCEKNSFSFTRPAGSKLWQSLIFPRTSPKRKPVTIKVLAEKLMSGRNKELAKFVWKSQDVFSMDEQILNAPRGQSGKLVFKVTQSSDVNKM